MLALILLGLLGGLMTGVSPCVLAILPIIFFAGAAGPERKQYSTADGDTKSAASTADSEQPEELTALAEEQSPKRRSFIGGRPLKIIAGVIVSLTILTLAGSLILSALGLPDSLLRWIGVALLVVVGLGLIFPQVDELIQKPFYRLPKVQGKMHGNAFVFGLGMGMGTLYVPCAGPVLAAITVAGETRKVGAGTGCVDGVFRFRRSTSDAGVRRRR